MKEEIIFEDREGLRAANQNVTIVTFLCGSNTRLGVTMLVKEWIGRLDKLLPNVKVPRFSLKYCTVDGLPNGCELIIALVPLEELKRMSMEMEWLNGNRVADIDIYVYYENELCKVSRSSICTQLALR